jgi:F-type H+-transporting ATPase subunit epsilon
MDRHRSDLPVAKTFRCRLITPQARVLDEDATYVQIPLHDGSAGILPRRAAMLGKLGLGELRVDFPAGGSRSYFLDGGFGQMVGDSLTILAKDAIAAERLSEQDAKAELAEAEARKPSGADDAAKITHDRARARLKLRLAQTASKTLA